MIVPTVERGLAWVVFCSMEIVGATTRLDAVVPWDPDQEICVSVAIHITCSADGAPEVVVHRTAIKTIEELPVLAREDTGATGVRPTIIVPEVTDDDVVVPVGVDVARPA